MGRGGTPAGCAWHSQQALVRVVGGWRRAQALPVQLLLRNCPAPDGDASSPPWLLACRCCVDIGCQGESSPR